MSVKLSRKSQKFRDFAIPGSIEKEDKQLIENISSYLKNKYKIDSEQLKQIITKKEAKITIPIAVFNKKLSALETIIKFLRENYRLSFKEISWLLNRSYTTIVNSYKNSLKKYPKGFVVKDLEYVIPVSILKNRRFSTLEIIVSYLKEEFGLRFSEIAKLLKRDVRTIWTVHQRYKEKNV